MTPEEARLVQLAAALAAAQLRGDEQGQELLLQDMQTEGRVADAFVLLAIVAADSTAGLLACARDDIWVQLDPPSPAYPAELVNRAAAVALAKAVGEGDGPGIAAVAGQLDAATAFLSASDLAMAAIGQLAQISHVPADRWCEIWAGGAAAGAGVEET